MKLSKEDIGELICIDPDDKPYRFIKLERLREVVRELLKTHDNFCEECNSFPVASKEGKYRGVDFVKYLFGEVL